MMLLTWQTLHTHTYSSRIHRNDTLCQVRLQAVFTNISDRLLWGFSLYGRGDARGTESNRLEKPHNHNLNNQILLWLSFFKTEFLIGSSCWRIICYQGPSIELFSNHETVWELYDASIFLHVLINKVFDDRQWRDDDTTMTRKQVKFRIQRNSWSHNG